MATWTKLRDLATFRVKTYDNTAAPKVLVLTMMFAGVEPEEIDWREGGSWVLNQRQRLFCKQFSGFSRDAFQVALERGAPTAIAADAEYLTTDDTAVVIEEAYRLDYIMADGIMVPQVPATWNPYREDTDPETEDLYHYHSIDLHYRWEEDTPYYTLTNTRSILPDPYLVKRYNGHTYMLPEYDPENMPDGSTTIYHQLGGDDIGGEFYDENNFAYNIIRCHPLVMAYLQNIPLDLLQQFYYHGGWPATILGCDIWSLFDGTSSHPNYTDPPGADPTACFVKGELVDRSYLAVVLNNVQSSCCHYAMRTYNRNADLWKRAFWWHYIVSQHTPPWGVAQFGGYVGATYALLQYAGKALLGLPIVYAGPSRAYPSLTPMLGGLFVLGASLLVNSSGVGRRRHKHP